MSELRKTQTCHPLERAEQARTEKTRALYAYWQRLQAAGLVGTTVAEYSRCDFSNSYLDKMDYSAD